MRFGNQGRYRITEDKTHGASLEKLQKIALKHSWSSTLNFVKPSYLVFVYTDIQKAFYESRDYADHRRHLQVYTTDGDYLKSDIPIPGGGVIDVDEDGFIYIWENTDIEQLTFGKYRLKVE